MSFGVHNTERAARVLAELIEATVIKAPTPPFPHGSWLVCTGDAHGTLLEILPATSVFDPLAALGVRQGEPKVGMSSSHVLVSTGLSAANIMEIASGEGWLAQEIETGLFKIVKVWIEGVVLVELLPAGEVARYTETFGSKGMPTLNQKLRDLEATLGEGLAKKVPPHVLAEALGVPAR